MEREAREKREAEEWTWHCCTRHYTRRACAHQPVNTRTQTDTRKVPLSFPHSGTADWTVRSDPVRSGWSCAVGHQLRPLKLTLEPTATAWEPRAAQQVPSSVRSGPACGSQLVPSPPQPEPVRSEAEIVPVRVRLLSCNVKSKRASGSSPAKHTSVRTRAGPGQGSGEPAGGLTGDAASIAAAASVSAAVLTWTDPSCHTGITAARSRTESRLRHAPSAEH